MPGMREHPRHLSTFGTVGTLGTPATLFFQNATFTPNRTIRGARIVVGRKNRW